MSAEKKGSSGGVSIIGLLTLLFVALKLTGVIAWPWLWVLSPIWLSAAGVLLGLVLIFIVGLAVTHREK